MAVIRSVALAILALGACAPRPVGLETVPTGTWGGDDGGLIVTAEGAHAHIGCTLGDVAGTIALDAEGRFDIEGRWNVDAFPVNRGIVHPARIFGRTDGATLSLAVRLTDTHRDLGPVLLTRGREPRMQDCPICRR